MDYEKLSDDCLGEPSLKVQALVEAAREIQRQRFGDRTLACNVDMGGKEHRCPAEVRKFCQLDETSNSLNAAQTSFAFTMNQMPTGAHHCGFSRGREDRAHPSSRGLAIPAEAGDDMSRTLLMVEIVPFFSISNLNDMNRWRIMATKAMPMSMIWTNPRNYSSKT